jgi:hypothetical protein
LRGSSSRNCHVVILHAVAVSQRPGTVGCEASVSPCRLPAALRERPLSRESSDSNGR